MAREWGRPPWELRGEEFYPWTVYVWQTRFVLYENEKIAKQQRDMDEQRSR